MRPGSARTNRKESWKRGAGRESSIQLRKFTRREYAIRGRRRTKTRRQVGTQLFLPGKVLRGRRSRLQPVTARVVIGPAAGGDPGCPVFLFRGRAGRLLRA